MNQPSPHVEKVDMSQPSPLAGEGGSRRLTGEGPRLDKRSFAKHLRKEMTDVEKKLWQLLRGRRFERYKFRRQVPIGKYIADFVCYAHRLVIELDGSQHDASLYDRERDGWLGTQGFKVVRFWNSEITDSLDGTLLAIEEALRAHPSSGASRHLLPARAGRRALATGIVTPHPAPLARPSPTGRGLAGT